MKPVVLLDLGNTLVRYYELKDFQPILQSGIRQAMCYLDGAGFSLPHSQQVLHNVSEEDYESPDHRVRPLEDRLKRIFGLKEVLITPPVLDGMCRHFMTPIFACARVYDDTLPFLRELRLQGFDTGIISNAPWGSPSHLWHEELERHGLDRYVEHAIFCSEVGWRKPAPAIFQHALRLFGVEAKDCCFIGDDPRWDRKGTKALGMPCHIIERQAGGQDAPLLAILDRLLKHS